MFIQITYSITILTLKVDLHDILDSLFINSRIEIVWFFIILYTTSIIYASSFLWIDLVVLAYNNLNLLILI